MECQQVRLPELLQGELTPQETTEVLAHLQECKVCKERVQVMAAVEAGFVKQTYKKNPGRYPVWLMMTAAGVFLTVIAAAALYFLFYDRSPAPVRLAELATREAYPYFPLEVRSAPQPPDAAARAEQMGFSSYAAGEYGKAVQYLSQADQNATIFFYRGVAAYLSGMSGQAEWDLQRARRSPAWSEPADWYLANNALRQNQREEAATILGELARRKGQFSQQAAALLEKLPSGELRETSRPPST